MSFQLNALELLQRTETGLASLISDAVQARAYGEIVAIASIAAAVAAIETGSEGGRGTVAPSTPVPHGLHTAAVPGWMQPRAR